MKELRKCGVCGNYFWTAIQPHSDGDNLSERLKFCKDCWERKLHKSTSLEEIERENSEMSEQDIEAERERFRRFGAN